MEKPSGGSAYRVAGAKGVEMLAKWGVCLYISVRDGTGEILYCPYYRSGIDDLSNSLAI
jgi:hypothetical protein